MNELFIVFNTRTTIIDNSLNDKFLNILSIYTFSLAFASIWSAFLPLFIGTPALKCPPNDVMSQSELTTGIVTFPL